jgi:hypothetical protein
VCKEHQVLKVLLDQKEVLPEQLVLLAQQDLLDHRACKVFRVFKDLKVHRGQQALRVLLVLLAL